MLADTSGHNVVLCRTLHTRQAGRFDVPDRLFHSVIASFRSSLEAMADVKELVPEFYCLPDVFINSEHLKLGELQDGAGKVLSVLALPCCCVANCLAKPHTPSTHPHLR